jgi:sirohydrochlorin cobaltochelatase
MIDGSDNPTTALILFAHGARDPAWAGPMVAVRELILKQQPKAKVTLAFLEQIQPNLSDAVTQLVQEGVREIVIYPMFIATGSHLKKDLPELVQTLCADHPSLRITLQVAAGEQFAVQQAIAEQALHSLKSAPTE